MIMFSIGCIHQGSIHTDVIGLSWELEGTAVNQVIGCSATVQRRMRWQRGEK